MDKRSYYTYLSQILINDPHFTSRYISLPFRERLNKAIYRSMKLDEIFNMCGPWSDLMLPYYETKSIDIKKMSHYLADMTMRKIDADLLRAILEERGMRFCDKAVSRSV